jgi:hypothetical protein
MESDTVFWVRSFDGAYRRQNTSATMIGENSPLQM